MTAVSTLAQGVIPLRPIAEMEQLLRSESLERFGRSARLLRKEGDLHVLMVALAAGAALPEHSVQGPALVQAIRGELTLHAGDESWALGPGGLLSIEPGLEHSVETTRGCVMLVVVQNAGELNLFGSDAPIRCGCES